MMLLLLGAAVLVTLLGAVYEVSLLAVSRAELAEAINRRLRGVPAEPLDWPRAVERELAGAAVTVSAGAVALGVLLPAALATESPLALGASLALFVVPFLVLSGYVLPRVLAHGRAARLVAVLRPLLRPWVALLRLVLPAPVATTGEYRAIGRESAAVLPDAESEIAMVGGVMTFAQRPVSDVMTPRTEIVAVSEGASVAEVSRTFAESGYSRLPVYRESLDEIVGMVHAFDLFLVGAGDPLPIRPVALAPASRPCGDLLVDMQRERRHLAIVLDEFGGTRGLVAFEDLLRALVGEIFDEDDLLPGGEAPSGLPLLEAAGTLPLDGVEEHFGVTLPAGHAASVGGRLAELAGRIPGTGERLVVAGLEFDVLHASPTRIERLAIRPATPMPIVLDRTGA